MNALKIVLATVAAVAMVASAQAQKPSVYPAKGQSSQQKQKDDQECMAWAKQDTGIDPAAASAPPPQQTGPATGGGERAKGAARGAAVGAIAGDAGTGAAVGVVAGGSKARKNQAAQNDQAKQQQQQTLSTFYRAYGACMEGRGYTIK